METLVQIVAAVILVPALSLLKSKTGWQDESMALATGLACLATGALVAWLQGMFASPQPFYTYASNIFITAWAIYQFIAQPLARRSA